MIYKAKIKGVKPLSANHIFGSNGKVRSKTADYVQFCKDMDLLLPKGYIPGQVEMIIKFGLIKHSYVRCDVDNLAKATIDAIGSKQIIDNDSKILKLELSKYGSKDYVIDIHIKKI